MEMAPTPITRLLRLGQVSHRTGLSRSALYQLVASGEFPRPIRVTTRAVAWIEDEVEHFIQERIARSRALPKREVA